MPKTYKESPSPNMEYQLTSANFRSNLTKSCCWAKVKVKIQDVSNVANGLRKVRYLLQCIKCLTVYYGKCKKAIAGLFTMMAQKCEFQLDTNNY